MNLYPEATHELSRAGGSWRLRQRLHSTISVRRCLRTARAEKDQAHHCGRHRPRHAMSLLHPGPHPRALRDGASRKELMEAIWVAAEMRAGAAFAHSIIAIDEMDKAEPAATNDHPAHTPALEEHHDH